jgi:hypothetical protein
MQLTSLVCTSVVLPVMLSSKLLPEMETEDNAKRELLLNTITKNPVQNQIEKLKVYSTQIC